MFKSKSRSSSSEAGVKTPRIPRLKSLFFGGAKSDAKNKNKNKEEKAKAKNQEQEKEEELCAKIQVRDTEHTFSYW